MERFRGRTQSTDGYPQQITFGGTIPALIWWARGDGRRPAVISVHGGGGHKGDIDPDFVQRILARGVTVVTIDAHRHGDRPDPIGPHSGSSPGLTVPVMLDVIEQTGHDLARVVDELRADAGIDPERIGLRGGSMGSYISLFAVSLGLPVCAVLSICGAVDYLHTFAASLRPVDYRDPEDLKQMRDRMAQLDPLSRASAFPPRPILMIHGQRDPLVPIAGQRALFDALVPLYADRPQDCVFVTHAGEHGTPMELELYGLDWLLGRVTGQES